MATPSERLLDRLRALGLAIPEDAHIARTYAGVNMLSQGAWRWRIDPASGADYRTIPANGVGSHTTVTTLLRGPITAAYSSGVYGSGEWCVDPAHPHDLRAYQSYSLITLTELPQPEETS